MHTLMELINRITNSMSFRLVTTLDVTDEADVPEAFTGRVRRSESRALVYIAWYVDGRLHNPGRHHPAYRRFRANGDLKYELYYEDGLLHDPTETIAAVRGFYSNGAPHYEERYQRGLRHDGADGTAAVVKWREGGTQRHELHYYNGRRLHPEMAGRGRG